MKKIFAIVAILFLTTACRGSMLTPDVQRIETQAYPTVLNQLNWRTIAPGCVVRMPVPSVEGAEFRHLSRESDSLTVDWRLNADYTLTATFHAVDGEWRLCSWDTSNV